jgi:PncC family amidohydrolase
MTELRLANIFPDAAAAGGALRAARLTIAVGESCTGGLVGAAPTAIPGSSRYMRGGMIAYSDSAKASLLGVSPAVIARFGAVSEQVARAMADGARDRCSADVGVGVTGVAGPGGGSPSKPVGLIFICVAGRSAVLVERLEGDRGREQNRSRAVATALRMCIAAAGVP